LESKEPLVNRVAALSSVLNANPWIFFLRILTGEGVPGLISGLFRVFFLEFVPLAADFYVRYPCHQTTKSYLSLELKQMRYALRCTT
jgi:hypothetical protein